MSRQVARGSDSGKLASCRMAMQGLHIPDPWSVNDFAAWLAGKRRRPINLKPWPTGNGIHGCWVATEIADYIMFDQNTTPLHQQGIILHELSHMWLGHAGHSVSALSARWVLPHDYSSDEEEEAETLALLILEKAQLPSVRELPADAMRVQQTFDLLE